MICLNVQGFIKKYKDEIENVYLRWLRPSMLGFMETHVTNMIEDHELDISGYVCVRGDSESPGRTGEVLLYILSVQKSCELYISYNRNNNLNFIYLLAHLQF